MKCGILTISVGLMNYGNRLQNYALQEVLKKYAFDVKTIDYKPTYPEWSYDTIGKSYESKDTIKSWLMRKLLFLRNKKKTIDKKKAFQRFVDEKIAWTNDTYGIDSDYALLQSEFDFIVVGSDQVWNPYWEGTQEIYFLDFMPDDKKLTYAVSFGVGEIPDNQRDLYSERVKNFKHVLCREDKGVEIVNQLGNTNATQVLDPVFLQNKEEWEMIEEKPIIKNINNDYILVYFLGNISEEYRKIIKKYKKELNISIIFLDRRDEVISCFALPQQFLYLVRNAKLVCTDSFHGCAFSLVMNTPFVAFDRSLDNGTKQDMSSRMKSLFNLFDCNDRYYYNLSNVNITNMDFCRINKIIEEEKKKSIDCLTNQFG